MATTPYVPGILRPRRTPKATNPLRRRQRAGWLFVAPAMALVVVLFVAPTIWTVVISFFDYSLLGELTFIGVDNYARAFADAGLYQAIGFTTLYTVVVTVVLLIVGFALALLVSTPRRGVSVFRTVYVVPVVIGFATASYMTLWILDGRIGVVNAALGDLALIESPISWFSDFGLAFTIVIILVVWKTVGLTMLLLMSGMNAISEDIYEAAQLDGAGWWRRLGSITLPLLKPTIALVLILTVISSYLAFDQFFILTQGGPDSSTVTVVYLIYRAGFIDFDLGYAAALSVVLMVILLLLTIVQFRILRQGDDR
ncbi:sugar ABC transporter permease [Microbacterium sp. ET2]|uniref:carbohydrate ABC transporter permease n=1 Tax=Microbacterium albipurpureum TaxID=3050384 RepID=UPI00259CD1A1|nr:sugar ABC transporter permease [Microbacterium sp. ET2 (Ac-2212)]WJL97051.1 sugar ABC transporter permease [Microbacterium sp. ET2 (Ac-2212)]